MPDNQPTPEQREGCIPCLGGPMDKQWVPDVGDRYTVVFTQPIVGLFDEPPREDRITYLRCAYIGLGEHVFAYTDHSLLAVEESDRLKELYELTESIQSKRIERA